LNVGTQSHDIWGILVVLAGAFEVRKIQVYCLRLQDCSKDLAYGLLEAALDAMFIPYTDDLRL
jgi:hypothetical protein